MGRLKLRLLLYARKESRVNGTEAVSYCLEAC